MNKKIIFIMSDSEAYLRDEVIRMSKEWGFTTSNVKTVEEWNPALARGAISLFGDVSMVHLDLSDKNKLKKFTDLISDKKYKSQFENDNWFGHGLIITSIHAQGVKKIENLVTNSGGKVIKKAKPGEMKKKLLARVKLNKDSKEFLDNYAGEDYQILIPIVNQLEHMDKKEQLSITIEDLIVRLPSKPGSVLPWEFIDPMLEGNANEAVSLYKRSMEGSHVLVTMQLARKKLQMLYRLKLLDMSGIWNSKEQAAILGERNGPNIWNTAKVAKKISLPTAEYLAKLALETEAKLKGYSSANPDIIFTNFIATVCLSIKYNKVLPLNI